MAASFADRHGLTDAPEITVRYEAPLSLREFVVDLCQQTNLGPTLMLDTVRKATKALPSQVAYFAYGHVVAEMRDHLLNCSWVRFYEAIEEVYGKLSEIEEYAKTLASESPKRPRLLDEDSGSDTTADLFRAFPSNPSPVYERPPLDSQEFGNAIDSYFRMNGIGWQMVKGKVEHRGEESFEATLDTTLIMLEQAGTNRSRTEFLEARRGLSRRTSPDVTGAISRATNALESVARFVTDESDENWGNLVRKHPELLPEPMMEAARNIREYAQENARHVREDKVPRFEDAELAVHVSAAAATYLLRKYSLTHGDTP